MTATYDVVIIGAGIHGAGVAQAVSACGWSALVVDRNEPASGTSSQSSKLIHGGLRYLETLQLKLVFECLRERNILLRNAPNLVKMRHFYIPIYRRSRRSPLRVRLGLSLYALLGGLGRNARFVSVPRREWNSLSGIKTQDLVRVFRYQDAQTDDAALTRAVLGSAQTLGADVLYHHALSAVSVRGGFYHLMLDGDRQTVRCRALVNAAGPWVNRVADLIKPEVPRLPIELVQGAHIVLNFPAPEGCFYLESQDDGRAVFALPWHGHFMVGTTETRCEELYDPCQPLETEVDYLLRVFNTHFPGFDATRKDVVETMAGLRVLPQAKTPEQVAHKLSRETQFVEAGHSPFYVAIYGGKLTSFRATAEKVAERLKAHLPEKEQLAKTENLKLEG